MPRRQCPPARREVPVKSSWVYRNLPNTVSVLGVLPIALLLLEDGARFLVPLLIYNNIMDDLDGQLAVKLDLKSEFGATLDNLCDAVAHVFFVIFVGMTFGGVTLAFSMVAVVAILMRMTSRIVPPPRASAGSPTNELMRHLALVLVSTEFLGWSPQPWLLAVFAWNSVSMLVPYALPHSVRSLTKTTVGIAMVNVTLLVAWLVPEAAPVIAVCFLLPYLYSLTAGGIACRKRTEA